MYRVKGLAFSQQPEFLPFSHLHQTACYKAIDHSMIASICYRTGEWLYGARFGKICSKMVAAIIDSTRGDNRNKLFCHDGSARPPICAIDGYLSMEDRHLERWSNVPLYFDPQPQQ